MSEMPSLTKAVQYTGSVSDPTAVVLPAYQGIYNLTDTVFSLSIIYPFTTGDGKFRLAEEIKTTALNGDVVTETILPRFNILSGSFDTMDEVTNYARLVIDNTVNPKTEDNVADTDSVED